MIARLSTFKVPFFPIKEFGLIKVFFFFFLQCTENTKQIVLYGIAKQTGRGKNHSIYAETGESPNKGGESEEESGKLTGLDFCSEADVLSFSIG